jgi:large subunit ribosomal protein L17
MKHAVAGYKLGRNTAHRRAMFRNMAISLLTHEQITTTLPKAKALQPYIEKLISLGRKGDLASRRRVIKRIGDPIILPRNGVDWDNPPDKVDGYRVDRLNRKIIRGPGVVKKLFDDIAPRYADRPGGFTRIIKLGKNRLGDGADLVVLQLVKTDDKPQKPKATSTRRRTADKRTAFAAKVRKQQAKEAEAPEAEAKPEAEEAVTEAPAPETEAAPEAKSEETKDE